MSGRFSRLVRLASIILLLFMERRAQAAGSARPQRGFGGREITLRFTIADAPAAKPSTTLSFVLTHNDLVLARGQVEIPLVDGRGEGQATVTLPPVRHPVRASLNLTVEGHKTTQPFWIFPSPSEVLAPILASPQVLFVDAPPALRELAQAAKGRARFIAGEETAPDN